MIYSNSFFKKELKEVYFNRDISIRYRINYALFIALLSFGGYLLLATLDRSILAELAPRYFDKSYFSILSVYADASYLFFIIYLAVNYRDITFAEIKENKWYILMKFGFDPVKMIFDKLYARLFTVIIIYGAGFFIVSILATILKYPFVFSYFIPLFILGLTDMIFVLLVTMTSSLFFSKGILSDYAMAGSVLFLFLIKGFFGYYQILNDKSNFIGLNVLYNFIEYFFTLGLIGVLCILAIIIGVKVKSKYYHFSFYVKDLDFSDEFKIVFGPNAKSKNRYLKEYDVKTRIKISSGLTNSVLVIIISVFILFNVFILLITISSRGKEPAVFDIIPYVFQSETLEPAIMFNDMAFFELINSKDSVDIGDIVLYESGPEEYVARIKEFAADSIIVDIDNYPAGNDTRIYRKTINRNQIYGRFVGRSRWLGVLVLFSNTSLGRIFLLLVPTFLLFYYKPISDFFKYINLNRMKE